MEVAGNVASKIGIVTGARCIGGCDDFDPESRFSRSFEGDNAAPQSLPGK